MDWAVADMCFSRGAELSRARNTTVPPLDTAALVFSPIRTLTVGFGITPNLLNHGGPWALAG